MEMYDILFSFTWINNIIWFIYGDYNFKCHCTICFMNIMFVTNKIVTK